MIFIGANLRACDTTERLFDAAEKFSGRSCLGVSILTFWRRNFSAEKVGSFNHRCTQIDTDGETTN